MDRDRLLVVDADLPPRLATELRNRDRAAISAAQLGLNGVIDPELLHGIASHYADSHVTWVLVTGDDAMPAEHAEVIRETEATIATIHPEYPDELTEHGWRNDVIHRWAHAMQEQAPQSVRRYTLSGSQIWRPRRRHLIKIREHGWRPWSPPDV